MRLGTFSIVARCKETGDFGVASATGVPCVGALVPFAQEGVGAVATQAWTNVNLGHQGLQLMGMGISVKEAMEALLREDKGKEKRQVIAVDPTSCFGFTGKDCTEAKGHIIGSDFAVAGNILTSNKVLENMKAAFESSIGELGHRILTSLEAGAAAGGDQRGKMSAVLLVASAKPKLYHDIRIDLHTDPVAELRRVYEECVRTQEEYSEGDMHWDLRAKISRVQK